MSNGTSALLSCGVEYCEECGVVCGMESCEECGMECDVGWGGVECCEECGMGCGVALPVIELT